MPIVDRLEFPKKYKLKDTMLLLVLVAAIFGLWLNSYLNRQQKKRIIVHSVVFEEYDRQFIRLGYEIENTGKRADGVSLLARVFDAKGDEVASVLFPATVKANSREFQSKYIDELNRPLQPGEKPYRATIQIFQRRLFGNQ